MSHGLLLDAEIEVAEARLAELVEEFIDRRRAGVPLDPDAFAAEHPELAGSLQALIPTLAALDELADRPAAEPGPDETRRWDTADVDRLGDFRILRTIGRGGMAVVYEAEQISLGRRVALKVLPAAGRPDERQLARFRVEAHAVAALNHPHIVPLFATGYERGVHYIAMPLIAGRSLAQVIAERRDDGAAGLAAAEAARLGLQAAEALHHAHGLGILHRDVKPANLLVDAVGHLWVVDFGLARIEGRGELTSSGDVLGTLRYTSPEQAAGRRLLDQRTDIYAIGATLYELLTLRPAFDGNDRRVLLRQIAGDEPTPPRRHVPSIPLDLETIVLKAMAREPSDRYESALELADDLGRFLADRPVRARRPGLSERAARWARRHRPAVFAGAAVAVLAVAGLAVGLLLLWQERGRTGRQAAQTRENLQLALMTLGQYETATVAGDYSRDPERGQGVESLQLDVIRIYSRLINQNPGDRGVRLRAAQAYHRLANIRAGLGPRLVERLRPLDADEAYSASLSLLSGLASDAPADPDVRHETGRVLSDRGWFLRFAAPGRAEPALREAMTIQTRLAADFPEAPPFRLALAETCVRLSYLLGFTARPGQVEDLLRQALRIRQELAEDSPASLNGIAETQGRLGHLLLTTGRVADGVQSLDRALATLASRHATIGEDSTQRRARAELITRICCPSLCTPSLADTFAPYFLRAVEAWKALTSDFPGLPDFEEGLADAWIQYARLMKDAGHSSEAESALRRAADVMERVRSGHPTVRRYRSQLAGLHVRLAECLDQSDRPAEALRELDRALELEPDDPLHTTRVALLFAVSPDPSRRGPARAIELAERLLAARPGNGSLWQTLGLARAQSGDWSAAAEALERSVSLGGHDVGGSFALALACWHLGDRTRARELYDEATSALADHERRLHRPLARNGYLHRIQGQAAALIDPANAPPR